MQTLTSSNTSRMVNHEISIPEELLWELLLDLKLIIKTQQTEVKLITIVYRKGQFSILLNELSENNEEDRFIIISYSKAFKVIDKAVIFRLDESYSIQLISNDWIGSKSLNFLFCYLPFCFYTLKAIRLKRAVSLLHYAQSLDGKIAALNGHSKMIGSHENFVHAHRLRALCDGIIIGSKTLKIDKPRLSVRLVKGPDPVKIVIGNLPVEFDSLLENNGKALCISSNESNNSKEVETIYIPAEGKTINPATILTELYKRGIHFLFIEGGAYTASSFLAAKSIDFLQLFISPKILGSGISGFSLNEITHIDDSINFSNHTFRPMNDGILFSGVVNYINE